MSSLRISVYVCVCTILKQRRLVPGSPYNFTQFSPTPARTEAVWQRKTVQLRLFSPVLSHSSFVQHRSDWAIIVLWSLWCLVQAAKKYKCRAAAAVDSDRLSVVGVMLGKGKANVQIVVARNIILGNYLVDSKINQIQKDGIEFCQTVVKCLENPKMNQAKRWNWNGSRGCPMD